MINLLEGVPGSGKSYEAVVYHVLPALQSGRKVITNLPLRIDAFKALYPDLVHLLEIRRKSMPIRGRWDAEAANRGEKAFIVGTFDKVPQIDSEGVVTLEEKLVSYDDQGPYLEPPSGVPLFGSVWDFYTEWRGKDGIGPLYVIDECHVSFPAPKRGKPGTAEEVIQWFKISRHFGADLLLMTQRMKALEEDIAGLAEFHFRVRKAAFLGRPNNYIRKVFAGYFGGEVTTEEREYLPQFFPLYKSHTQGQTVIENLESDVNPAHLKWQKWSRLCFVFAAVGAMWLGYRIFFQEKEPPKQSASMQKIPLVSSAQSPVLQSPAAAVSVPAQPDPVVATPAVYEPPKTVLPDPLHGRNIHMTGCLDSEALGKNWCTFVVSQNGVAVFSITSKELQEIGFEYKTLGHCAAVLTWEKTNSRAVICDAPSIGMKVSGLR